MDHKKKYFDKGWDEWTPEELIDIKSSPTCFPIHPDYNMFAQLVAHSNESNMFAHLHRRNIDYWIKPPVSIFLLQRLSWNNHFRYYITKSFYDQGAQNKLLNKLIELKKTDIALKLEQELNDPELMNQAWPYIKQQFMKEENLEYKIK